eukprot:1187697-Prymnesium_polylepis.1
MVGSARRRTGLVGSPAWLCHVAHGSVVNLSSQSSPHNAPVVVEHERRLDAIRPGCVAAGMGAAAADPRWVRQVIPWWGDQGCGRGSAGDGTEGAGSRSV